MNKKLREDDRQAVDLLLDRTSMIDNGATGSGIYLAAVGDNVAQRVPVVEAVLRLLSELPVAEASGDLAHRTLERIRQHGGVAHPLDGQQQQPNIA